MQNVRANVKVLEFQSLCIFSCILSLLIILIKPLTTKAYDRRASSDCGTSGHIYIFIMLFLDSDNTNIVSSCCSRDIPLEYRKPKFKDFIHQKSWSSCLLPPKSLTCSVDWLMTFTHSSMQQREPVQNVVIGPLFILCIYEMRCVCVIFYFCILNTHFIRSDMQQLF